jgi:hypothetical protein
LFAKGKGGKGVTGVRRGLTDSMARVRRPGGEGEVPLAEGQDGPRELDDDGLGLVRGLEVALVPDVLVEPERGRRAGGPGLGVLDLYLVGPGPGVRARDIQDEYGPRRVAIAADVVQRRGLERLLLVDGEVAWFGIRHWCYGNPDECFKCGWSGAAKRYELY